MYTVDDRDRVVELETFPQFSTGAPIPILLATEHQTFLLFYLQETPPDWDGTNPRSVGVESSDMPLAIVSFERCYATMFGPPDDQSLHGHPLAGRGLEHYGAFEVKNSSWLRGLVRMGDFDAEMSQVFLDSYRHYILTFEDSTFECLAGGYRVETMRASVKRALSEVVRRIR